MIIRLFRYLMPLFKSRKTFLTWLFLWWSLFSVVMFHMRFCLLKAAERLKAPIIITEEDVNIALKGCTPMSLQDVQLYKSGGHSWSDIGGLTETKSSLTEILQWPLKYPEIFKNAPIKLQSGVLLYGMPGTGKTMLAKAIAGECGVNLISIKVESRSKIFN